MADHWSLSWATRVQGTSPAVLVSTWARSGSPHRRFPHVRWPLLSLRRPRSPGGSRRTRSVRRRLAPFHTVSPSRISCRRGAFRGGLGVPPVSTRTSGHCLVLWWACDRSDSMPGAGRAPVGRHLREQLERGSGAAHGAHGTSGRSARCCAVALPAQLSFHTRTTSCPNSVAPIRCGRAWLKSQSWPIL